MPQLECTAEELEVMRQLLQRRLATLDVEIRHTDHAEFRNMLKHLRQVLEDLLGKLPDRTAPGAG